MNQNIRTTDEVTFAVISITATSTLSSINSDSGLFYVDAYTNKVGIGTNGPSEKLTVSAGNAAISGVSLYVSAACTATTTITTGATGAATSSFIGDISAIGIFAVGDGSATSTIRGASAATSTINSGFTAGNNAAFVVNQAASANTFYIDPTSNVGVATSTPSTKFAVQGDILGIGNIVISGNINTGQGASELYLMNQNIRTTDEVTFAVISITATSTLSSINSDSGLFYVDAYTNKEKS